MVSDYIHKEVLRLVKWAGTRDPFKIANRLGIHVIFNQDFNSLKGMYKVIQRSRFIFIKANLNKHEQRVVCAHELGHDRFHKNFAKANALQEFVLYNMRSKQEYEANIFASELLIDDNDIFTYIEKQYDVFHMASEIGEDINLILIKIDELRQRGYDLRVPYRPQSDFLRHDN
ncbi:MAG: ImmA/IrrE family metallo-endopeptidase [Clostridiales bacterium]|jgi:Zn-dependent peptidase ImmA (M78 family)|nr:ImmA/IrrE family metallo-endopeptidase [Clostridiales bacterium]